MSRTRDNSKRPFGFFVHHQGRGHAKRCEAILAHLDDRPITILSADRSIFGSLDDRVTFVELPNHIGDPSETPALFDQQTPEVMHCVPMGSARMRDNAALLVRHMSEDRPGLFFVDVSAEWAMLARFCSVPALSVRMHGERGDPGHLGAYQASVGMVAPYHESLEQADYPAWARRKTFYSGGLCTTTDPVPTKAAAREALGLDPDREIILTLSGGGGSGAPYAPLTVGARAVPDALWLTIGPLHREGHETDFANLVNCGWVNDPLSYIAAADVVIASAGDNTVHEIARVGRPYMCVPEWRYFDEQTCKGRELSRLGAAHVMATWPGSNEAWRRAIGNTRALEVEKLQPLFDDDAARKIADYMVDLDARLWARPGEGSAESVRLPASGPSLPAPASKAVPGAATVHAPRK